MNGWKRMESAHCSAVAAATLLAFGGIRHGMTTRQYDLNLSLRTGRDPATVKRNRAHSAALLGARIEDLLIPDQVHGSMVAVVRRDEDGAVRSDVREADALITDKPGILLGITIADCLPVFLYDPVHRAVALAHSGWRGTAGRIVANTLHSMRRRYGTDPRDVVTAIGAGICGTCYEVGDEVREALLAAGAPIEAFRPSPAERWMLDLPSVVADQLRDAGVPDSAVTRSPWCTSCDNDLFFSHRKEGPSAGRMGAFIMIRSTPD